jgi:hypothetical protein
MSKYLLKISEISSNVQITAQCVRLSFPCAILGAGGCLAAHSTSRLYMRMMNLKTIWKEWQSTRHVGHFWPIVPAPGDCENGEFGEIKIGRGNRITRRKPTPEPLCPPKIPLEQTRARTQTAVVGSQPLTTWAMARPVCTIPMRCQYWITLPYLSSQKIRKIIYSYLCHCFTLIKSRNLIGRNIQILSFFNLVCLLVFSLSLFLLPCSFFTSSCFIFSSNVFYHVS